MSVTNGTAVDIARLQERTERNQAELAELKTWVSEVQEESKENRETQSKILISLERIESSLNHVNSDMKKSLEDITFKLALHDQHDMALTKSFNTLQLSYAKTSTKFKVVLGILTAIGLSLLAAATKLVFFSSLNGG